MSESTVELIQPKRSKVKNHCDHDDLEESAVTDVGEDFAFRWAALRRNRAYFFGWPSRMMDGALLRAWRSNNRTGYDL